jgi:hypothetical protein
MNSKDYLIVGTSKTMKKSPSLIDWREGVKSLQIVLTLEFFCRFMAELNSKVLHNEKVQMFRDNRNVSGSKHNFNR